MIIAPLLSILTACSIEHDAVGVRSYFSVQCTVYSVQCTNKDGGRGELGVRSEENSEFGMRNSEYWTGETRELGVRSEETRE